ncbi:MAG: DedA family protein [Proteobacteria bacterium]|nr:DedA family protein [Pseudomonadota bacterium]
MESLIATYGYLAIIIGTFLEGETILILGGFAAHQGYLTLFWVIMAAFAGSLCGDQLFFFLGRRHSQFILSRRPSWQARMDKAQKLMDRFKTPLILVFRFLYGLRTLMPFMIDMSQVPTRQFVALNTAGALVWAIVVGSGGYVFGHAIEIVIGDIKHYEFRLFAAIVITGLLVWIVYFERRGRK